jgi:hypothetical protein
MSWLTHNAFESRETGDPGVLGFRCCCGDFVPEPAGDTRHKDVVSIDDILEALSNLDHSPRTPPGGKPARLKSTERVAMAA